MPRRRVLSSRIGVECYNQTGDLKPWWCDALWRKSRLSLKFWKYSYDVGYSLEEWGVSDCRGFRPRIASNRLELRCQVPGDSSFLAWCREYSRDLPPERLGPYPSWRCACCKQDLESIVTSQRVPHPWVSGPKWILLRPNLHKMLAQYLLLTRCL